MSSVQHQILAALRAVANEELTQEQFAEAVQNWRFDRDSAFSDIIDQYSNQANKQIERQSSSGSTYATHAYATPATTSSDASTFPFGDNKRRYEVLRGHAKGGLGEVFIARDHELQRDVALKEIQSQHSLNVECRARFVLEAQVTGSLEHPGIVPVYSLGRHPDGRLYYTMRFIEGDSLKEAVDRSFEFLDPDNPAKVAGRSVVAFRKLLNRFIHVCNAVEYAHVRGVLHRDIKPANIMLGKYNETLLVDWGLAKIKGEEQTTSQDHSMFGQHQLRLQSTGESSATQMGAMVGTPGFMSPEQAQGNNDLISSSCDIYSLGATLYYLLTGKPPFERDKLAVILDKVKSGDFPAPREVLATVPKGLEAICLKAMALEPKDRYSHASDIAEDIERWLADEPIGILKENMAERLGRWTRRNRSLVVSILVGLTALTVISSIATFGINQARSQEKKMKNEAIIAKNEAIVAKNDAIDAKSLADEARQKLSVALEQSKTLAYEKSTEAAKATRLSSFLLSLFKASDPIGQGKGVFIGKPQAVNLTARDLLDRGAAKLKADKELDDVPLTRAAIEATIGDIYRNLSVFEPAEKLLKSALEIRIQQLPSDHSDLAESYHDLGALYHEQGDYAKGYENYSKALGIRRKLLGEAGQLSVASTLNNLGWLTANEGDAEEGKRLFLEAAAIRERISGAEDRDCIFSNIGAAFCLIEQDKWLEAVPKLIWAQQKLSTVDDNQNITSALTSFAQGLLYRDSVSPALAEPSFREAYRLVEMELGPDSIYTALARYELGVNLVMLGRDDEAMPHFDFAIKTAKEAIQLRHPRFRSLIVTYTRQLRRLKRFDEGESLWEDFVAAQTFRFGDQHRFVYEAMFEQAYYLSKIRKTAKAKEIYKKLEEGLVDLKHPIQPWLLASTYCEHSTLLCKEREDFSEVARLAKSAIAIFESHPHLKREHLIDWTYIQCDLGEAYVQLQNSQASNLLETALRDAKKFPASDRPFALNYIMSRQTTLALMNKDLETAVQLCRERRSHCRKRPDLLMELADNWVKCLDLLDVDEQLSEEQKKERSELHTQETIAVLKTALDAGWNKRSGAQLDKRFDRFKDREDFKILLKENDE